MKIRKQTSARAVCAFSLGALFSVIFSVQQIDKAPAQDYALDPTGTYGKWLLKCASCNGVTGFNGLIVKKNGPCINVFFEAAGPDKDYTMFAAGRMISPSTLVAYQQGFEPLPIDGKFVKKKCKVVFEFSGRNVRFVSEASDLSAGCTAGPDGAAAWLDRFSHAKMSSSTSFPQNADHIYGNNIWNKKVLTAQTFCADSQ